MKTSHEHPDASPPGPNWSRINQWVLWIGLAAAVGWMFFRHNAHIGQLLPFLILLACPLMHLFGHGGHGGHAGHGSHGQPRPKDDNQPPQRPGGSGGHQH
ncbi:MAG: DUF2933 domain-containing protein [Burkholderiaceae bacterium]|jgi:hypothetical protein|nr:DUF2933 domain-containing protein [Burkholderiaceae bacterium]